MYLKFISVSLVISLCIFLLSCENSTNSENNSIANVAGLVLEAGSRTPVYGARINNLTNGRIDTSNVGGEYSFDSLTIGTHTFEVKAIGYDTLRLDLKLHSDENEHDFELGIPPCDNRLVEDPNRSYVLAHAPTEDIYFNRTGLYVRFIPEESDTTVLRQLAESYGLQILLMSRINGQWVAGICIKNGRLPEYFFTPYGKNGYCNFGFEPKVEYCFGIFDTDRDSFSGTINIVFKENIPEYQKDSLFTANGLRKFAVYPGTGYQTIITRSATMNVADLAVFLTAEPIVERITSGFFTGGLPIGCF